MKRSGRRLPVVATLLGLLIGGALAIPLLTPIAGLEGLQLSAGDQLFANEKGPHIGFSPHRNDIVIVSQDVHTAEVLGGSPTPADDVALYQTLLAEGASVVGDPRPVTSAADATTIVHGLEQQPGAAGHVFRNIELPASNSPVLSGAEKTNYVGADVLYADAASDVNNSVRYYPLISVDSDQHFDETLVLKVARVALGLPLTNNALLLARNAGIVGIWARLTIGPNQITGSLLQAVSISPSPYPLGPGREISWVVHPSVDLSTRVSPASIWIRYRSAPTFSPNPP